jgi:Skp family chaperone for outer membrane proteins
MATTTEVTRENPKSKGSATMPRGKSAATLEKEIERLEAENGDLQSELENTQAALDDANDRLSQIYDLSSEEPEPEDFEEDFEGGEGPED